MTRKLVAIATAFFAVITVFASAAEAACLSCEHVPVVVRGSLTSDTATRSSKKRFYARAKARAKAKAKARAVAAARAKAKAKAIAAAEAAAAEEAELAEATDMENSTISTSTEVAETEVDETEKVAAVSEDLGCKKFFPTIAMTLTVPCE